MKDIEKEGIIEKEKSFHRFALCPLLYSLRRLSLLSLPSGERDQPKERRENKDDEGN